MPIDYSQIRTHTNDPYPPTGGGARNYNRSNLIPLPSIQGQPLHSADPHGYGDIDETYVDDPVEQEKRPTIDPVRTMIGGVSGLLGGAAGSPIGRLIKGKRPVLDPSEMATMGAIGAGTVGAATLGRQILSKLLRG